MAGGSNLKWFKNVCFNIYTTLRPSSVKHTKLYNDLKKQSFSFSLYEVAHFFED